MHVTAESRARRSGRLHAGVLLLVLAGCGAPAPPPPATAPAAPPARTVFDELTRKERELPAAVDEAQRQHAAAERRALDAAEGGRSEPTR